MSLAADRRDAREIAEQQQLDVERFQELWGTNPNVWGSTGKPGKTEFGDTDDAVTVGGREYVRYGDPTQVGNAPGDTILDQDLLDTIIWDDTYGYLMPKEAYDEKRNRNIGRRDFWNDGAGPVMLAMAGFGVVAGPAMYAGLSEAAAGGWGAVEAGGAAGGAMDMGVGLGEVAQGFAGTEAASAAGGAMDAGVGLQEVAQGFNAPTTSGITPSFTPPTQMPNTQGGSVIDRLMNWVSTPTVSSSLVQAGAGLIKGAMSPTPQELYQAKTQAEVDAAAQNRANISRTHGMTQSNGAPVSVSTALGNYRLGVQSPQIQRPGLISTAMR